MSIYVDDMGQSARLGRINSRWSHLVSIPYDEAELIKFAKQIGLKPEWIQRQGRFTHFDVTERKRLLAIKHGATPVTTRELVTLTRKHRKGDQLEEDGE